MRGQVRHSTDTLANFNFQGSNVVAVTGKQAATLTPTQTSPAKASAAAANA